MDRRDDDFESVQSIKGRRQRKTERFMRLQVAPLACKVLFITMLVLTPVASLSDVDAYLRFGSSHDVRHLLQNIAISTFSIWTVLALVLVSVSVYQLHRLKNGWVENPPEKLTQADIADNKRFYDAAFAAQKSAKPFEPERKYKIFCLTAVIGIVIFGIFLLLVFS